MYACIDNTWRKNMTFGFFMIKGDIYQQEMMVQGNETIKRWTHLFMEILWDGSENTSSNMNTSAWIMWRISERLIIKLWLEIPLIAQNIKSHL